MIRGQERRLRPNRPADLAERPQSAQPRRPDASRRRLEPLIRSGHEIGPHDPFRHTLRGWVGVATRWGHVIERVLDSR